MKKAILYSLLMLFVAACETQGDRNSNKQSFDKKGRPVYPEGPRNETMESNADGDAAAFMYDAALLVRIQMELASAAFRNSQNAKVKSYAQDIVRNYKEVQRDLTSTAAKVGLLLPEQFPADTQEELRRLKSMKGQDFDRNYLEELRSGNPKMITAFEAGTDVITDEVKYFAETTLPVIKRVSDPVRLKGL
jgi:predicted outer membrane protein